MLKLVHEGHTQEVVKITGEITLIIDHDDYHGTAGILKLGNNTEIEFDWSPDAEQAFRDIDVIDAVEILTIIAQVAK